MTLLELRLIALSCSMWTMALSGLVILLLGNPAGGFVMGGASSGGAVFTAAAVGLRRRAAAVRRPDYDRIERLELELGITERPKPLPPLRRSIRIDRDGTEYRSWGA